MSAISDKYAKLKSNGLDLGAPAAAEEDAPEGGRVRRYEHGHIYWSRATGAHEVHGGILARYLEHGGPGADPSTGRRLGYPLGDEEIMPGTLTPISRFEHGQIVWTSGTGGCVVYGSYAAPAGSDLGLPITGTVAVAGGEAVYFQRGLIFWAGGAPGVDRPLVGTYDLPKLGHPLLLDPTVAAERRFHTLVTWRELKRSYYDALVAWRPSVFSDLVNERFGVAPPGSRNSLVPLHPTQVSEFQATQFYLNVRAVLDIFPNGPRDLHDRTLYDVRFRLPSGDEYTLAPHAVYTKAGWETFGLLHITDLHVNRRNEEFRARLQELGLADAAKGYSNFQDNLRDFIRYANHLHAKGLADAVVATGDLVDYVQEDPEPETADNFARLHRLILGQPLEPGVPAGEELRIPIFTTLGNHDYRVHPYALRADVDLPGSDNDRGINEHGAHNLIESEALALQGNRTPRFTASTAEDGVRMLRIDEAGNAYKSYDRRFAAERSYVVKLGRHRLVVLDTKYDHGLPGEVNLMFLIQMAIGKHLGVLENRDFFPATQKLLNGGGPDSVGLSPQELGMVRNAVVEAGADGLVIVGMHCPPFHVSGGENPYFLRETMHPVADPALTDAFVARRGIPGSTWSRTGTPHFKDGDLLDGMDDGFIATGGQEFLEVCAGSGLPRPVDLVLYGHHHDRVEHRVRLNPSTGKLEFFTDFYTENPKSYYGTINGVAQEDLPAGATIAVQIVEGAAANAQPTVRRVHGPGGEQGVLRVGVIRTPPYPKPLDATADAAAAKAWWSEHRPLFAQSSALGPIEERQRLGQFWKVNPPVPEWRPTFEGDPGDQFPRGETSLEAIPGPARNPTFQGFRLIQVRDGAIHRMRYVTLADLRANNFSLPWEGGREFDPNILHIGRAAEFLEPTHP